MLLGARASSASSYSSPSASAIMLRPVEWRCRTTTGAITNSSFVVTMQSRCLKRTCALGTQLIPWLAIRGLMLMSERAKVLYLVRQLSVFRVNTNE